MANYFGDMYDNVLTGGPDDDVLWGGAGDDELSGGRGNDRLIGGPGADALDGGAGMDVASYTSSTRGVRIDLATSFGSSGDDAPVRGGDAEGDSLTSIESIWGSNFADLLIGSRAANYLFGNGGNDRIWGGSGDDHIRGGDGDDILGDDDAEAEDGSSERGNDVIYGDAGFDFLSGAEGDDMLFGGMDDDTLMGGMGDDVLEGGPGADEIDGGEHGMMGDTASYTMSDMAVTVNLGVMPADATAMNPHAMGGDATGDMLMNIENLRGSMHDDMLTGDDMGVPKDAVLGDNPATTDDTETDFVVEEAMPASAGNRLFGNMGDDTLKGMGGEDTLHGGKGDDVLYGGDHDDMLMGEMGDDKLKGQMGDDTLIGGPGADVLLGGTLTDAGKFDDTDMGTDTASYAGSEMGVTVDLGETEAQGEMGMASMGMGGDAEGDILHGIENLTGSDHTDLLVGNDMRNVLMGGKGDDWDDPETTGASMREGGLFGGDGHDLLSGGDGMDHLDGQAGRDDIWGGDGDDMLMGGAGDDAPFNVVAATGVATTLANAVAIAAYDIDEIMVVGTTDADTPADGTTDWRAGLFGGKGDDTLDGGAGNDLLMGMEGDDVFIYDAADTNRDGGAGSDTLDASEAAAGVTIDLSLNDAEVNADTDPNNDTNLAVRGIENVIGSAQGDSLTGGEAANMLMGGKGADAIDGGMGADTLDGGDGRDNLTGGMGADVFVFSMETGHDQTGTNGADFLTTDLASVDAGDRDTVTGFSSRQGDMLDLSALGLSDSDLDDVLAAAVYTRTFAANTASVVLDLRDHGGGVVNITLGDGALVSLEADDFML